MTAKAVGGGDSIEVTWAGAPERPSPEDEARCRAHVEEQFARIFGHTHHASAVTVGPHVPTGDDDDPVG